MAFVHLHTHSHYSLLDGLPKIPELVARARQLGMGALALTDHGVLYGAVEFYKEARRQGLKPIIGVEAYVAPNQLTDKRPKVDDSPFHLTLLAENREGYQHLLELVTTAHLEGFYYKPRVDRPTLARLSGGLICLSGCLGGEVAQALLRDDEAGARRVVAAYRDIFGPDRYFLEVQSHPTLAEQQKVNVGLRRLAVATGTPLVATKDSHYLDLDDREAQDALVCIQTGKLMTDTNRLNMTDIDVHLAAPEEMVAAFRDLPEALENTGRIAERCNLELTLGQWIFPGFEVPAGTTVAGHLAATAARGLAERLGEVSPTAAERLRYELEVITQKGYASYFLVVADFVTWARSRGISSTTRGSAAGSLVAYALGITTVNPLEYDLPFERFLNPWRPSPPDIDMDFADNRRDEVIAYVREKYGEDRVAQIITFGTMQARAAVRDIGRVLGYPYALCDRVAKLIPLGSQGFHMTIERALEVTPELRELSAADPQVHRLLDLARKVEGCARHASVHAAGVVIAPEPLVRYVPLQREAGGESVITQYEFHAIDDIGLLKMDFLGIRNLSILGRAVELIERTTGTTVDLNRIPMNDRKTYRLLARGETMGLFQLGGSGMTRYLRELRPTTIHDIMAMVALFRPGPMNAIPDYIRRKHNPKSITYLDPRLKPILERSFGIVTYQDDVLLIAINLAGYNWEQADQLRKAMGKKIPAVMAAERERFIRGCLEHSQISGERAEELWKLIEPFAAYGFNKAHAASYGIVAYQTAYLKANYPSEYMTAVLTAESGDLDTVAEIVAECRRMGIEVLPPDINESFESFTRLDGTHIRFGLLAIKNIGADVARAVIAERLSGGPFRSLEDFLRRIQSRNFNKKFLESLIKSGALDEFGDRQALLGNIEALLKHNRSASAPAETSQGSLFSQDWAAAPPLTLASTTPTTKQQRLAWERELLGLYLTEHPLAELLGPLQGVVIPLSHLPAYRASDVVALAGVVEGVRQINTKAGEPMCFVKLVDLSASAEIVVFPSTFRESSSVWSVGTSVVVAGRVSRRDGDVKVIGEKVEELTAERLADTARRWQRLRYQRREPVAAAGGENVDSEAPALLR